jgi:uncharacterized protein YutE (UPF0331/DUF86 family)
MGELPDMAFLCIVPEKYGDMGTEMTPALKGKIPEMEKLLLKELAAHGIIPERLGGHA